jgi:CRP-like cAMP-binding protein
MPPPAFEPKAFPPRRFDEGSFIIREGDPPGCAYVVQSGKVEIFRGKGVNRRQLGTVMPGGIFGEMALIDNSPRMADAIAATDTVCLVIPPAAFREKLDKADPFIRALLRILVRNTRSLAEEMD